MMKALDNNYQYSFFFLPSHLNLLNQYATSTFPMVHLIPPPPKKRIVQALPSVDCFDQLFKRSPASVIYNRVLSHFQFAERFYVNAIYREQFS